MKNHKKVSARVLSIIMAAAMMLTSVPTTLTARAASKAATLIEEGVNIAACDGILEAEMVSTGDFNCWNLETGETDTDGGQEIGVVRYAGRDWQVGKWKVYITTPGKYRISTKMKVEKFGYSEEPADDNKFYFKIGKNFDNEVRDPAQERKVFAQADEENYQMIEIFDEIQLEEGLYGFQMQESSGDGNTKVLGNVDYFEFDLLEAEDDGGIVDISTAWKGILQSEKAQPLEGTFASYRVNLGVSDNDAGKAISTVEWDGASGNSWAGAKWKANVSIPGTYKVTARMKISKFDYDPANFATGGFSVGIRNISETETDMDASDDLMFTADPDNYQTVTIYDDIHLDKGLIGVKFQDNGNGNWTGGPNIQANLDYLQFKLIQEDAGRQGEDLEALNAAKEIYQDSSKPTQERVNALLGVMTLEEKAAQMVQPEQNSGLTVEQVEKYDYGSVLSGGGSAPSAGNTAADWQARVNELKQAALDSELGIPLIYGVDGVHGHNNVDDAVIFPHNIGLGAADDPATTEEVGAAAAEEIRATGIQWTFAPMVGVVENERWGRYYESFGENVDKVTEQGVAYTEGFQGTTAQGQPIDETHVAASVKHYLGEGQTKNGANKGDVTDHTLEELVDPEGLNLLKPYKEAVDAGAKTVMASYNSIQGLKCHANADLINKYLKTDLGFEGFVISDYNAIQEFNKSDYEQYLTATQTDDYTARVAAGVNAGVDMFMEVSKYDQFIKAIQKNVEVGTISENTIDEAVSRILTVKFDMGLFEEKVGGETEEELIGKFGGSEHRAVAEKAAEKTLTVLKNDKVTVNGETKAVLDFLDDANAFDNILVAGQKSQDVGAQCGGWTISWQGGLDQNNAIGNIQGSHKVTTGTTVVEGFKNAVEGTDKKVLTSNRGSVSDCADVAIVVVGEEPYAESNGDRAASDLVLPGDDIDVINNVLNTNKKDIPTVLVLMTGRPVAIADYVDKFDAVVEAWLPGSEGGQAIANVMLDEDKDFTGKSPITWTWYPEELTQKDVPAKVLFPYETGLKKDGTSIVKDGQTTIPAVKPEAPEQAEEKVAPLYKGAVDIDKADNKLEGEWSGSGNWNVSIGSEMAGDEKIGYVEWSSKEWGNAKWDVYFRQAGTYKAILHMKVTDPAEGDFTDFKFCTYETGDPNPDMSITGVGATDGYVDFVIDNVVIDKVGVKKVKIMDSSKEVNAKLDYIQFELVEPNGEKDESVFDPATAADETPMQSEGTVISEDAVNVWMTSTEKAQDMSWYKHPYEMKNQVTQKDALDITTVDTQNLTTINVDPSKTYQEFLGTGTSLEEATVNNLLQLKPEIREEFIESLVDPKRGAMTLFRVTIATADFTSQNFYTYFDVDGAELGEANMVTDGSGNKIPDWYNETGHGFSIQKDRDCGVIDTIHMVQEAAKKYGVEDEIKFFASSWTPPGWMKDKTSFSKQHDDDYDQGLLLRGGKLKDDCIDDLAMYYLRFLEEYAKEGIDIYAMTLQNEPQGEFDYPSCLITGDQEAKLALEMKKLLPKSGILAEKSTFAKSCKLWAFDHNPSGAVKYMEEISQVEGGLDALDGIAFHDYDGPMDIMQQVYDEYLNKGKNTNQTVNLTERSVWGTKGANSIISYFRNNAISYNSWVTMLDSNVGIHQWPGTPDPTMFARDAASDTDYWAMPEFYISAQFARFIRPGYVRVDSDPGISNVGNVVFKNPETGELVAVVSNGTDEKQNMKFVVGDTQFICAVPAKNVATFVWNPTAKAEESKPGTDNSTSTGGNTPSIGGNTPSTGGDKPSTEATTKPDVVINKDGSTTTTTVETSKDGSTVKTEVTENKDGSEKSVVTETTADGQIKATTTVADKDGKVVSVTEKNVIKDVAKNTDVTVVVKKDGEGKVSTSKATVTQSGSKGKATLSGAVVKTIEKAAGTSADITMKVTDDSGKTLYTVKADSENLEAGKKLCVYKLDTKTNKYVMVNAKTYKVSKSGSVSVDLSKKATYELVTTAQAKAIEKQIKATIKVKKSSVQLANGKTTTAALKNTLDMENVKSISYSTTDSKILKVNKNGTVRAKGTGTAVVKVKVVLKNGSTKTVKMKISVK